MCKECNQKIDEAAGAGALIMFIAAGLFGVILKCLGVPAAIPPPFTLPSIIFLISGMCAFLTGLGVTFLIWPHSSKEQQQ